MANISDVNVTIEAKGCAKEVQTWLKVIDKDSVYNICNDHDGREWTDDNSAEFSGYASGRWSYYNNIEGGMAGTEEQRQNWCGGNKKVEIAFNAILLALKDNPDAYVEVNYTECELGCCFIAEGCVRLEYDKDTKSVVTSFDHNDVAEPTIDTVIEYGFAGNEEDAKEYLGIEE